MVKDKAFIQMAQNTRAIINLINLTVTEDILGLKQMVKLTLMKAIGKKGKWKQEENLFMLMDKS